MTTLLEALQTHKLRILSYNPGSKSANALRDYLQPHSKKKIFIVSQEKYKDARDKIVLNWGVSKQADRIRHPAYGFKAVVNCPESHVSFLANKRLFFNELNGRGGLTPRCTSNPATAQEWVADGKTIVARHALSAHSGIGTQVVSPDGMLFCSDDVRNRSWLQALMFTEYFAKSQEYRVFVLNGQVVLTRRKRKANGADEGDGYSKYVRVHRTGWNFCAVEDGAVPPSVHAVAREVYRCLGLRGMVAFDVGYKAGSSEATVFEGNSAPGIEGETIKIIGDAFLQMELPEECIVK